MLDRGTVDSAFRVLTDNSFRCNLQFVQFHVHE